MAMTLHDAMTVIARERGDRVVITGMSAAGAWKELSDSPLDFIYIPSAMGQAPTLGLGIALAQPRRGVIVVNGDGSMLMNLGCLATLANHPADVYLVVIDNDIYEVTGGQKTAGSGHTDFAAVAHGTGFRRVYSFDSANAWRSEGQSALSGPGPVMIVLHVEGRQGQKTPTNPRPMLEQVARFREALK